MRLEQHTTNSGVPNGRRTQLLVDGEEAWVETWLDQPGSPTPRVALAVEEILGREPTEDELYRLHQGEVVEVAPANAS